MSDFSVISNKPNLSCLHLNAQSARNKDDLIITLLDSFNMHFDVVMITETWYHDSSEVLRLPCYTSYFINRIGKKGGGVLMLVKNSYQCEIVAHFSQITDNYEILTLHCSFDIFSVVYRPPGGNVTTFLSFLDTYLSWVNESNYRLVLGGDLNINLLCPSSQRTDLYTTLDANAFKNFINEPTRVQPTATSLIDVFITNAECEPISTGVLKTHISDHLPIYLILNRSKHATTTTNRTSFTYRSINNTSMERFRNALSKIDWESDLCYTDAESAYESFIRIFVTTYNKCFLYKTGIKPRNARKPWVTSECLKAIREKNALYSRFIKSKSNLDWKVFRTQRNRTNSLLRRSKKLYFENLFNSHVLGRPDIIWKNLNALLNRSRSQD